MLRAQFVGVLPGTVVMIIAVVLCYIGLAFIGSAAAWIAALWAFVMILGSLQLLAKTAWWFLKSFFVSSQRLLEDINRATEKQKGKTA